MTENKRYIFIQNGNLHTVKDTKTGKPLIVEKFKENEFGRYFCFHKIIDLLNEQEKRINELEKGILDCLYDGESIGMFAEKMGLVE